MAPGPAGRFVIPMTDVPSARESRTVHRICRPNLFGHGDVVFAVSGSPHGHVVSSVHVRIRLHISYRLGETITIRDFATNVPLWYAAATKTGGDDHARATFVKGAPR